MKPQLKYFVYSLNHNKGVSYFKTAANTLQAAINNVMAYEGCPKQAITIYTISKELFSLNATKLFIEAEKQSNIRFWMQIF